MKPKYLRTFFSGIPTQFILNEVQWNEELFDEMLPKACTELVEVSAGQNIVLLSET